MTYANITDPVQIGGYSKGTPKHHYELSPKPDSYYPLVLYNSLMILMIVLSIYYIYFWIVVDTLRRGGNITFTGRGTKKLDLFCNTN